MKTEVIVKKTLKLNHLLGHNSMFIYLKCFGIFIVYVLNKSKYCWV